MCVCACIYVYMHILYINAIKNTIRSEMRKDNFVESSLRSVDDSAKPRQSDKLFRAKRGVMSEVESIDR